jgi:integrase
MNLKLLDGLSPKTVRYMRQVFSNALNQAIRWNLISRNIATLVSPPRVERFEISPLDESEARQFVQSISNHRLRALFTLALALGLRQSEGLGLRWTDIDLDRGLLMIRYQLLRVSGEWRLAEPKTKSSRRTLPLPRVAIEALQHRRVSQEQEREAAGARWTETHLVFTTKKGTPLHSSDVVASFHKALAAAGLKRRRFHDLRHTCATLHLVQAVSPRVVMEILGHSEIALTMETYTHVPNGLKRQAADRIDELLRPPSQRVEANPFDS